MKRKRLHDRSPLHVHEQKTKQNILNKWARTELLAKTAEESANFRSIVSSASVAACRSCAHKQAYATQKDLVRYYVYLKDNCPCPNLHLEGEHCTVFSTKTEEEKSATQGDIQDVNSTELSWSMLN